MCTSEFVLTDPARRDTYLDGLRRSIPVANRLGCRTLITQVGPELPNIPRAVQHASIVDGLKACVPLLESAGITLVFEPLNLLVNHPGYYLSRSDEAFEIAREVSSPFVKVLYDIYHQQITEGNLIATITANAPLIGHIHAASVPGRHELTHPSEINYPAVFAALKNAGYTGAVGLEYIPVGDPSESLRAVLSSMPL